MHSGVRRLWMQEALDPVPSTTNDNINSCWVVPGTSERPFLDPSALSEIVDRNNTVS